jgi:hypothetical protein
MEIQNVVHQYLRHVHHLDDQMVALGKLIGVAQTLLLQSCYLQMHQSPASEACQLVQKQRVVRRYVAMQRMGFYARGM